LLTDSAAEQHDNALISIHATFDLTLTQSSPTLASPLERSALFSGNIRDSGLFQGTWAEYVFSPSGPADGFVDFIVPGQITYYRFLDSGDYFPTVSDGFLSAAAGDPPFTFLILQPTPEPGSVSLLMGVLAILALVVRRKRLRRSCPPVESWQKASR
jgi:hypothetical protein